MVKCDCRPKAAPLWRCLEGKRSRKATVPVCGLYANANGCSRTSASLTTRSECPTRRLINVRKPIPGRSVTAKSSVSPPNPRGMKRVKLSFNQSQSSWAPKPALAPDNLRADPDQKSTSVALTPEHKTQKVEFQGPRVPLKAPPGINLPSDGVPTLASP